MGIDKRNIPNIITGSRLVGAVVLLFLEALSLPYIVVYTICGFTDCIDGRVARKLKAESEFGAKLDSFSDLVFYSVMLIKVLPIMWEKFNKSIFVVLGLIIVVRLIMYVTFYLAHGKMDTPHTVFNKITGVLMYLLPYGAFTPYWEAIGWLTCSIAIVAIIHQITINRKNVKKIK